MIFFSRRWSREHKAAVGSPVFGYMATASNTVKAPVMGAPPYQLTLEDRVRWAQIADVMAQANHYAVSLTVCCLRKLYETCSYLFRTTVKCCKNMILQVSSKARACDRPYSTFISSFRLPQYEWNPSTRYFTSCAFAQAQSSSPDGQQGCKYTGDETLG